MRGQLLDLSDMVSLEGTAEESIFSHGPPLLDTGEAASSPFPILGNCRSHV